MLTPSKQGMLNVGLLLDQRRRRWPNIKTTFGLYVVPLDMKGCICSFVKWQIHPYSAKGTTCVDLIPSWNPEQIVLFRAGVLWGDRLTWS